MLATFVIGLREGLEAALIVGIIAAFLQRNAKPGAVRQMWFGVVIAVVLCLAAGIGLQVISAGLPQRQQEMLECVVAAIAVVMVSYMILWMRKHSRGLKTDLEREAGSALAQGSAFALVAMAFLAVLREGLETAVFLLAAFQASGSAVLASVGALLGIAVAVLLGWFIYRGGLRLNLSKFFRITGVVLVLVAAGLVAKALRAAYEAGWLTIGQQHPLDLTSIARPGSVQASLLTGVLGITAQPALIEILGFVLYAVPMMMVVLWPPKRQLSRLAAGRLLTGVGLAAAIVAVVLAVTAPVAPTGGTVTVPVTVAVAETLGPDGSVLPARTVEGTATVTVSGQDQLSIALTAGDVTLSGTTTATAVGSEPVGSIAAVQYRSGSLTPETVPASVPTTLTGGQVAALAGRLPIGLRAADADAAMPATFTDTARATIAVTPDGRQVVDVSLRLTRSVTVTTPTGLPVTIGAAGGAQVTTTAQGQAELAAAVAARAQTLRAVEIRGQVIPIMLGGFAVIMLAFGVPRLFRRVLPHRRPADPPPPIRHLPTGHRTAAPWPPTRSPPTRSPLPEADPAPTRTNRFDPEHHVSCAAPSRSFAAFDRARTGRRSQESSVMTVVSHHRRAALVATAIGLAIVASACGSTTPSAGSSSTPAASPAASSGALTTGTSTPASAAASTGASVDASSSGTATPGTVEIVVSEADGCVATPNSVPAGAITFHVVNQDAAGVTEVELVSDERIRGERENLAPGFEDTFSVKLDGGSYEVYCPGASTERAPFTVTGEAAQTSTDVADLLQQATVDYADYVDLQTGLLVEAVKPLVAAIKAGDLAAAQTAYAQARAPYERVEPVAESFGDLDPAIDARAGDVPEDEWTGFHPIEQALFEKKTTKGLDTLADKLQADVEDLQKRAQQLGTNTRNNAAKDRYQPDEVANGAVALLGEVQASKITGEEERYSHIDLLDFAANVEGSQQAFAALKPALNQIDPTVVPTIDEEFDALTTLLDDYKDPSELGGYVLYVDLEKSDTKKLTDGLLAVIEPLSDVSAKIANA